MAWVKMSIVFLFGSSIDGFNVAKFNDRLKKYRQVIIPNVMYKLIQ